MNCSSTFTKANELKPKRKQTDESHSNKRSKLDQEQTCLKSVLDSLNLSKSVTSTLDELRKLCLSPANFELPRILFLNQLYAVHNDRTGVDREIDRLKRANCLLMFKYDSASTQQNEICICAMDDFVEHVCDLFDQSSHAGALGAHKRQQVKSSIIKILKQIKELSVDSTQLRVDFNLSDADITLLIQLGLLTIKSSNRMLTSYWLSIPGIGKFKRVIEQSRRLLINSLRKNKYNEINSTHLNVMSNNKLFKLVGLPYLVVDMIGSGLIRRIDSPIDLVLKLNE
jgi:hypothetical protein